MSTTSPGSQERRRAAGLFDIRLVIALLFVIYGVVLTLMGVNPAPEAIEQAAGVNINLWSGIGMLVFAALLGIWVYLRPVRVPEEFESGSESTD
ncbi:xanthine/uracil/vitamin C permease (AzgA family) [Lipingzhangella halophila]|uniref:Xanthine/uracil/vitamin C permease (AzgA family) n=1 Tax=Lipingzhangella halophila TaxID=1783352 RepID=A0A7W7RFN0_9ACTN|nr:hypothetical protein [Lipingzhangella halophila]MBB4931089.1 xanthine/uracil/vitamin C permease (AzgA family) [Lipingzhangella halophila]